jgi:parallel beta-helix repeat protein
MQLSGCKPSMNSRLKMNFQGRMGVILLLLIMAFYADAATLMVGPGDSIQAAIFSARAGDIILVLDGTYYEHINVDKSVILRGQDMPVLDATASGSAITLNANGITVDGFRVVNAGCWPSYCTTEAGIKVLSHGNLITGNNISNNFNGLLLSGKNNSILGNTISRNLGYGIRLENASDSTICNNSLNANSENAYDDRMNLWNENYYGNYDISEKGCSHQGDESNGQCVNYYHIPGGRSADRNPKFSA